MKQKLAYLILFLSVSIFGQKHELGEVTIQELQEKQYPKDTSAVAAFLFEKGKTYFEYKQGDGFTVFTEVEVKIKIYKKEGYDWANKEIPYYIGNQEDQTVQISRANTYNLVNGKIETTRLKSEGEYIEKKNKYWNIKKINMPNVKVGSIIEYKYVLKSPYVSNTLPKWYFQKEIPVSYSEYKVCIPEYHTYMAYKRGNVNLVETKSKAEKSITMVFSRTQGTVKFTNYDDKYQRTISYTENQISYKTDNIPALKDENFVDNIKNYTSSVEYKLQSIQYPESPASYHVTSWEAVAREIYEDGSFGGQLTKTNYFEEDIKKHLNGVTDKSEKIAIIFNYVKNRMSWDGFRTPYCEKGVSKAYEEKTGNVAEINLMLVAMLKYADLDASPVLLSTRSNGIALYPSLSAFDYVIAGVEVGESIFLLDATDKFSLPNILPERDLNWYGRIIRNKESSANINLYPKFLSKESTILMASLDVDGKLEGKIRTQKSDYNAYEFRSENNILSEENYLEKLEKGLHGIQISDYKIENKTDLYKPIVETFSFKTESAIEKIVDKFYINPLLFYAQTENSFKQQTRSYPVDFTFPEQGKKQVILTLPDGYAVDFLPAPLNLAFSDDSIKYSFNISNKDNQVQIISQLDINTSIVNPEDYEELKEFFNEVVKKQTEKIVLKKV